MIKEFLTQYGEMIVTAIIPVVGTYLGYIAQRAWKEIEKRKVVKDVVNAIEQLKKSKYKDKSAEEIKEIAINDIIKVLRSKGIKITDIEVEILIESVVKGFNS